MLTERLRLAGIAAPRQFAGIPFAVASVTSYHNHLVLLATAFALTLAGVAGQQTSSAFGTSAEPAYLAVLSPGPNGLG